MKINKSVSIDIGNFHGINEYMIAYGDKNFSRALNVLLKLGYATWQKQNKK